MKPKNPKPPPLHLHILESLVHLHHGLSREFAERIGLPLPRLALLHELAHAGVGGIGVNELARGLGVTPALVTRQAQELEREGWVRRRPDPGDRRRNAIVFTAKGMKAMVELHGQAHRLEDELLAGLDPNDLAAASRVLEALARRVTPGRRRGRTIFASGEK